LWAAAVAFALPAAASSSGVVISQVYGGGGNSGATLRNDFIELFNAGNAPVSVSGWSVQYSSATGAAWQVTALPALTLQAGQYLLVQEAQGAAGTQSLPTPDATGTIAMSGTTGKVALVRSTAALSVAAPSAATYEDLIGFGPTATGFEGAATAVLSNTTAALRNNSGCSDSNNNGADFSIGTPAPRNSSTALAPCGGLVAAPIVPVCPATLPATAGIALDRVLSASDADSLVNAASFVSGNTTGMSLATFSPAGANGASASVHLLLDGSTPAGNYPVVVQFANNAAQTANCSINVAVSATPKGDVTIFHTNDVHARLTPHKWVINQHGSAPDVFEDVGGAAALAGKMVALTTAKPASLVLDGGDISEGNPVGDMNSGASTGFAYGNGGMTGFYELLHSKIKLVPGRNGRGMDALVVGNHDVRDVSYVTNMEHMVAAGVPVISVNVRDIATHTPHFAPTTTVVVNGVKVGIIGYTTSSATVGASLVSTLEVVDCQWTGAPSGCNISAYVNDLRNNQGCDLVILLTHDGHSDLVDPATPVLADTVDAVVPEIAVTGHWHTWAETAWQPQQLNYKTTFVESSSYMKYIGELTTSSTGQYLSATQHVLRNADITPDPDVAAYVANLVATYDAGHPGRPVNEVVGYTNDNLLLDNRMKWWSADEYPWSGNNTAGQWITDAMQWKCSQIWAAQGGCDLAVEAGGGVRADIPAGAVTYKQVYETFPWADDLYVRIDMTGQDILNFLKATNLNAGFSSQIDVTAFDGIATSVTFNGVPIDRTHTYTVAINDYMLAHPPAGYTWPVAAAAAALKSTTELVRDSLSEYMRTLHATPATAYNVGGDRYHFNGEYSGFFRAVVTLMDDVESKPTFEKAFVRLLSANAETLARRGSKQVPADLVNADGSVNQAHRLAEMEIYRSFLGFKRGTLKVGDIVEFAGKAGFFDGNPEFVDQEGVYADATEFKILGHDESLAQPTSVKSIGAFWNDNFKNHLVSFKARKAGTDTVTDQFGQTIKVWDTTGFNTTPLALPGNVGDVLDITGVPTMENFALRFRRASVAVSTTGLPVTTTVSSQVTSLPATTGAALTLTAAIDSANNFILSPLADAQVASGATKVALNFGTSTNVFLQSSSSNTFGNERGWFKFDLSTLPAGLSVTAASLQLWNWKSTGASLPTEVRGITDDTWTETGLTYNNQPALGTVLDTVTLAAGATDLTYGWSVGPFVQQQLAGDKIVSLMVKPVSENSPDAVAPSYAFDAKEFGSNAPVLQVQAQGSVASVQLFYRYSTDNLTWGAWTAAGAPITAAPFARSFGFPSGPGYYEFYSLATDAQGTTETAPSAAQARVRYTAGLTAQSISFTAPATTAVGGTVTLSATASSGLPVSFASQSASVCTVSGNSASTLAVGTCVIAADQAGDASFAPATTVVASFNVVQPVSQSINPLTLPDVVLGTAAFTLAPTASSGLPVSVATLTPTICAVSGNTVQLLAVGLCSLTFSQAGDVSFLPTTITRSFSVLPVGGDVPLPPWALMLLAAVLLITTERQWRRRAH
jgi:2',3'-cyclic-nucleotide 2'-phosphodiesterase (5'-nucleotidase family)